MVKLNQKSVLFIVCSSAILSFIPQIRGREFPPESTKDDEMLRQKGASSDPWLFQEQYHSGSRFRRSAESTEGSQSKSVEKTQSLSTTNNNKGAPQSARSGSSNSGISSLSSSSSSSVKEQQASTKGNIFPSKGSENLMSILSKPDELLKLIAKHFNLDHEKLKKQVGQSVSLGAETIISPALAGIQIIEKVFVPDHCRLKLMCRAGAYVTARLQGNNSLMFKLKQKHIESSHFMRAFSEGHSGKDCEGAFPHCEPRLQKPYEDLMRSARETLAPLRKHLNGDIHSDNNSNNNNKNNNNNHHHHHRHHNNNQVAKHIH